MSSKVPYNLLPIEEENRDYQCGDIYERRFRKSLYNDMPSTSSHISYIPDAQESEPVQRFAGIGLEITSSVLGSLISHPCIVLRRQCQVNTTSLRYHLTPITLFPVIVRLQRRQGLKCLWKGSSSIFILRGCSIVLETAIAELTPFPKEVSTNSSIKQLTQHLLLKCITFGLLTPFYCSSLIETVQSDVASETPGVFDCLKEGFRRIFKWGTPQTIRLLPIWQLVFPTAVYSLSIYVISGLVHSVFQWFITLKLQKQREKESLDTKICRSLSANYFNNLSALHFASMVANIIMYPAETILHRLHLQGTRTIIDNLESGMLVLPVGTKYQGVIDCFHTIVSEEGAAGLYKGFGALLLEYALQAFILNVARISFQELEHLFRPSATPKPNI